MNKTQIKRPLYLILLLSSIIYFQCASNKIPLYIDENYSSKIINEIVVLPVLDLRVEQEREIEKIDKWVHRQIKSSLKYNKYNFSLEQDRFTINSFADFSEEEINEADTEWVKRLGPSDKNWIILPVILDFSSIHTFGSGCNVEMSAALYDKEHGKCVWRDKGIGRYGQGGLLGMAMKSANEEQAVLNAAFDCMKSLPQNTKKNTKKSNKKKNENYWN